MTAPPALHHRRLTTAETLLVASLPKLCGTFNVLEQAQPGYPSGGDNGRSVKGDHSDRTGDMASRRLDDGVEPCTRDLNELDAACARIAKDVTLVADIIRRWPARPNPDWAKALRDEAAASLNTSTDRWCASHLAVGSMEPTRTGGSRLCRWCEDLARTLKVSEPPAELVEKLARGQRITTGDVDKARKALKAKRKKAKR